MHAGGRKRGNLASIPKSRPEIENRCSHWASSGEILASIPKSGPEIKNRCTLEGVNGEILASIRKSGPEIENRCTKEGVNRQILASIRKSSPEIKNRCTLEGVNGEILASIRKSGPEIKNRCRSGVATTVCRRNHSSLQRRRLESDAELVVATAAAGGTITPVCLRRHPSGDTGVARRVSAPQKRAPHLRERLSAVRTRLELATPGVTGRYSNRLNYRTSPASLLEGIAKIVTFFNSTRVASDFFISL